MLLEHAPTPVEAERAAERVLGGAARAAHASRGTSCACARASASRSRAAAPARPTELLRNADLAMYTAKAGGRSRCAIFSPGMYDAELARHALVDDLREAIAQGQIKPHFQPLVELGSGRSWAVEALARWHHPRLGLLLPERFIELAEETDLINELGRGMLRAACRQAVVWRATIPGAEELVVSVNVSRHPARGRRVRARSWPRRCERENLPPQALMLELTESAVASDARAVVERCAALRELGVRVARRRLRHRARRRWPSCATCPSTCSSWRKPFVDALETRPGEREFVRVIVELGRVARPDRSRPRASRPRASWRCCASSASTSRRAT